MNLDLSGKTALVTGSSRGIGRAIAEALHAQGCRIAMNARDAARLATSVSQLPGSIGISADVSQPEEAQRLVLEVMGAFDNLDIVVCNVGSGRSVSPGSETSQEWQRVFAQNLWSTTNTVEAAMEPLIASKGSIVCISSICGLQVIPDAPITYSVAKAALHAYIRGIARPLGARGVRINAVAPGNILFEGSVWSSKLVEDGQAVETLLQRDVPLRCLGSPSEVAHLVAYLASSRAKFATGQVWTLDGGQTVC